LHLEAAKALEKIEGKVLPGCLSWQKIKCEQLFHSSLIFPAPVYHVIREQLEKILASFNNLNGISSLCSFSFLDRAFYLHTWLQLNIPHIKNVESPMSIVQLC
jgi:hypothetical protein